MRVQVAEALGHLGDHVQAVELADPGEAFLFDERLHPLVKHEPNL
jgi:hypothetical protein